MTDTINVPGMGATKKTTVYVAGAIGVVIIGVVWYRSRSTASSTPVDTTQIDPATGYPYGSPEDAAALQAQAAYVSPGGSGGGSSTPYGGGQQPGGYVSNEQWKRAADDYLINTVGLPADAVSSALGKYLAGSYATATEKNYIEQARASVGQPPVAGANGYPPSIRELPPTVKLPALSPAPRLSVGTHRKGLATLQWSDVPGASEYHVYRNGVTYGGYTTHGVNVNQDGSYYVVAFDGTNKHSPSGRSNNVTVNV